MDSFMSLCRNLLITFHERLWHWAPARLHILFFGQMRILWIQKLKTDVSVIVFVFIEASWVCLHFIKTIIWLIVMLEEKTAFGDNARLLYYYVMHYWHTSHNCCCSSCCLLPQADIVNCAYVSHEECFFLHQSLTMEKWKLQNMLQNLFKIQSNTCGSHMRVLYYTKYGKYHEWFTLKTGRHCCVTDRQSQ